MRIVQHLDIDASAEQVWQVVGREFTQVGRWASAIPTSAPTATGDGRECAVAGAPGIGRVTERLTAYDDDQRTLTYVAAAGMPRYVTQAVGTWSVEVLSGNRARVSVSAELEVAHTARLLLPLLRVALGLLGRRTLAELKYYVEHGRPAPRKRRQLESHPGRRRLVGGTRDGDVGRLLATAISGNVLLSGTSGVILLIGAPWLADAMGVGGWFLGGIGGGLLVFAGLLLALLSQPRHLRAGAGLVIAADVAWIAVAAAVLAVQPSTLTLVGRVALAGVTVAVGVIAASQWVGLRRAGTGPVDGTSRFSVEVQRDVAAPVAAVWDAVSDAGGYARFAPGIATTAVSGQGDDMVRICTDDHGSQWSERCTLWEPERRYRMSVDVSSYPLHYRMLFSELHQTWSVEPTAQGARVTLAFHGATKLGVVGRLAVQMLGRGHRLDRILDAYEAEFAIQPQRL